MSSVQIISLIFSVVLKPLLLFKKFQDLIVRNAKNFVTLTHLIFLLEDRQRDEEGRALVVHTLAFLVIALLIEDSLFEICHNVDMVAFVLSANVVTIPIV